MAASPDFYIPQRESSPSRILYNPARRQYWIDGQLYDRDDVTRLMGQARADLSGPPKRPNPPYTPKGWVRIPTKGFLETTLPKYIGKRDSLTIASKSFGRGVDILQQLGGRALEATRIPGVADWGWNVAEDQARQLAKTEYYATGLGDIEGPGDFGRWVVGALAEQAPMILATAGVGWKASVLAKIAHGASVAKGAKAAAAAVKAARAAPDAAPVAQLTAKAAGQAFKGANRYERMGATFARLSGNKPFAEKARAAAAKRLRGEALDEAEEKILGQAVRVAGAGIGLLGAQYGMGVGDVYGEIVESQAPGTTGTGASLLAAAAAAPYAVLGATGEGIVAKQLLKGVVKPKELKGRLAGTRRRLAQGARIGTIAAAAEGIAEGAQEGIVIGSRQAYTGEGEGLDDLKRVLEAAVTGALVGGVLGGAGGAARRPVTPSTQFRPEDAAIDEEGEPPPAGPISPEAEAQLDTLRRAEARPRAMPVSSADVLATLRGMERGRRGTPAEPVRSAPVSPAAILETLREYERRQRTTPGPVPEPATVIEGEIVEEPREAPAVAAAREFLRDRQLLLPPPPREAVPRATSVVTIPPNVAAALEFLHTQRRALPSFPPVTAPAPEQAGTPSLGAQPAVSPPARAAPPVAGAVSTPAATQPKDLTEQVVDIFSRMGAKAVPRERESPPPKPAPKEGEERVRRIVREEGGDDALAQVFLTNPKYAALVRKKDTRPLRRLVQGVVRRVRVGIDVDRARQVARAGATIPVVRPKDPEAWAGKRTAAPKPTTAVERVEAARAETKRERTEDLKRERIAKRRLAQHELNRRLTAGESIEDIWGGTRKKDREKQFNDQDVLKAIADFDKVLYSPDATEVEIDQARKKIAEARQGVIEQDQVDEATKAMRREIVVMERREQEREDRAWREDIEELRETLAKTESPEAVEGHVKWMQRNRTEIQKTDLPFIGRTQGQQKAADVAESGRVTGRDRERDAQTRTATPGRSPNKLREELGRLEERAEALGKEMEVAEEIATGGAERVVGKRVDERGKVREVSRTGRQEAMTPEAELEGWQQTSFLTQEIDRGRDPEMRLTQMRLGIDKARPESRETEEIRAERKEVGEKIEEVKRQLKAAIRETGEKPPKGSLDRKALTEFLQASNDRVEWARRVAHFAFPRSEKTETLAAKADIAKAAARVAVQNNRVAKTIQAYREARDLGQEKKLPPLRKRLFGQMKGVHEEALKVARALAAGQPQRGEQAKRKAAWEWLQKTVPANLSVKPWQRMPDQGWKPLPKEEPVAGRTGLTEETADVPRSRETETSGDVLYREAVAEIGGTATGEVAETRPDEVSVPDEEQSLRFRHQYPKLDGRVTPAQGMPRARVRAHTEKLLSKFRSKPPVTVTDDVASLMRDAPKVYRAALAQDPDFARKEPMGVFLYVDDQPHVAIFAKHVKSEGQVDFTLAHEVLGHYGLRGILNRQEFKRALTQMELDPFISTKATEQQERNEGMPRDEALEEALADYAADIHVSLLKRLWDILKNALNRIGLRFHDDNARHLVWSARRFVRQGGDRSRPRYFHTFTMRDQAEAVEAHGRALRFSNQTQPVFLGAGEINFKPNASWRERLIDQFNEIPVGERALNARDGFRKVLGNVMTGNGNARSSEGGTLVWQLIHNMIGAEKENMNELAGLGQELIDQVRGDPREGEVAKMMHFVRLHTHDRWEKDIEEGKWWGEVVAMGDDGLAKVSETGVREATKRGRLDPKFIHNRDRVRFTDAGDVRHYYQVPKSATKDDLKFYARAYELMRRLIEKSDRQRLDAAIETYNTDARRVLKDVSKKDRRAYVRIVRNHRREVQKIVGSGGKDENQRLEELGRLRTAMLHRYHGNVAPYLYGERKNEARELLWGKAGMELRKIGVRPAPEPKMEDAAAKEASLDMSAISRTVSNLGSIENELFTASDLSVKTLASGYFPFRRHGGYQVQFVAKDPETGKRVQDLTRNAVSQLYYSQEESQAGMERTFKRAKEVAEALGVIQLPAYDAAGEVRDVRVKIEVEASTKADPIFLSDAPDFKNMMDIMERAGNAVSTAVYRKMGDLYLTGSALQRKRALELKRTPGESKDSVRNLMDWVTGNATETAKRQYLPHINRALQDRELFEPSEERLAERVKAWEDMKPGAGKENEAARLKTFLVQYMKSAPKGRTAVDPFTGKTLRTRGLGGYYRNEAAKLRDFVSDPFTLRLNTDDLARKGIFGKVTTAAIVMQLGGSPATAALNITAIATNTLPFLATKNLKTNFGEGHGAEKAAAALVLAGKQMLSPKLGNAQYLDKLANRSLGKELRRKHGLDFEEAVTLQFLTRNGTLQASMTNELMGAARGQARSKPVRKAIEGWMWMFQNTETFSRRTSALAAFRLERERQRAAGIDPGSAEAILAAREAANRTVTESQGVYEAFNRPNWARNDLGRMLFTYKQFVITTLQMFFSLDMKGKAMFLGAMMFAGGLSELPFAQDIMDLVNTLQSKFGIRTRAIEQNAIDLFDGLIPGMGKHLMYGFLNPMTGINVGQRMGQGNVVPGTGMFLPGSSPMRETTEILGPVYSAVEGSAKLAGATFQQLVEAMGGKPDATGIGDVGKTSPVALFRNITNAAMMLSEGHVVGRNGKVATTELGPINAVLQILGFSPWKSAGQYLFLKHYRYVIEDAKSWRQGFVRMAMDARLSGDRAKEQEVRAAVAEHNRLVRRGDLPPEYEIRNFNRSIREATRYGGKGAVERGIGGVPIRLRPEMREAARAWGLAPA